jgi:hypothetical protein
MKVIDEVVEASCNVVGKIAAIEGSLQGSWWGSVRLQLQLAVRA